MKWETLENAYGVNCGEKHISMTGLMERNHSQKEWLLTPVSLAHKNSRWEGVERNGR